MTTPAPGYTVVCSVPGCSQETAKQAPSGNWRTADAAVLATKQLCWIHGPGRGGVLAWFCPMHQRWEPTSRRWVPDDGTEATA